MIKVYEIDGTFLGHIDTFTHGRNAAVSKHYRTEHYPNTYRDFYSYTGKHIGYVLEFPPGRGENLVFDMEGRKAGVVSQRIETLANGKLGVEINYGSGSQTWIFLDTAGDFWKGVGHSLRHMPIQKIGYLRNEANKPITIRSEDLPKVGGSAFLLTRDFFQQSGLSREPLWFDDVDRRYFRCKPGECTGCDIAYRQRPNWTPHYLTP